MARRAAALAAGRPRAYAATATGPQRDRDRGSPATPAACRCATSRCTSTPPTSAGARATLKVRAGYGVRGVRGNSTATAASARAAPQGWRVRAETTARERIPGRSGAAVAALTATSSCSRPPGLAADGLMTALEAGYARMRDVLPQPRLRRRYLVVVAATARRPRAR